MTLAPARRCGAALSLVLRAPWLPLVLAPWAAACPQVLVLHQDSGLRLCTWTRCCLRPGRPFWASWGALPPRSVRSLHGADVSGVPLPSIKYQHFFSYPRRAFEGSRPQPGPGCLEAVPTCSRPWGAAFGGVGSRRLRISAKSMCAEALPPVHPAGCCRHGLPSVHVTCSSPRPPSSIELAPSWEAFGALRVQASHHGVCPPSQLRCGTRDSHRPGATGDTRG